MLNKTLLLTTALMAVAAQPSWATSIDGQGVDLPIASAIVDGGFTLAPLSFTRFCMSNPGECATQVSETSVPLDADRLQALNEVNKSINGRIVPDFASAGRGEWSLTASRGDCNDYAVQKRHELITRGWPAGALALAVVMTESGKGHLVLSVRTDRGDLVLDNLQEKVAAWDSANYRWIKRQSAAAPQYWVDVKGSAMPAQHASADPGAAAVSVAETAPSDH